VNQKPVDVGPIDRLRIACPQDPLATRISGGSNTEWRFNRYLAWQLDSPKSVEIDLILGTRALLCKIANHTNDRGAGRGNVDLHLPLAQRNSLPVGRRPDPH
jgi:hypothetical protein